MPKRTDLESILIIGAGPIVIGQACEFDYSGAQACKALREEGYRVVLVNSNPATIMTDPEMADAHLHRADHLADGRARSSTSERPDALLPTMGGQTALNCALDLAQATACSSKYGVELIGATLEAIDKAEDREQFKQAMTRDRPRVPRARRSRTRMEEALRGRRPRSASRPSSARRFTLGGTGGGIAYNREEFERDLRARPRRLARPTSC
ncbi:MAG: hypothetical protein MZW92_79315 [Comamonadaceae bacterium]|nr:hypothetical protein [Comamonadaceae bacterium]